MKACCISLLLFSISAAYSQPAIVNSDNVNIRTSPVISCKVISKMNAGDLINVLAEEGTKKWINEKTWDNWYKIGSDPDKWINALYVTKFPFRMVSKSMSSIPVYDDIETVEKVVDKVHTLEGYNNVVRSKNDNVQTKKWYFKIKHTLGSYLYDGYWVDEKDVEWKDSQKLRLFDILDFPLTYPQNEWDRYETRDIGEIKNITKVPVVLYSVKCLAEIQLFDGLEVVRVMDRYRKGPYIYKIKIDNSNYRIKYGISTGMSKATVKNLLGAPNDEDDTSMTYELEIYEYTNARIIFNISDTNIRCIEWMVDFIPI